MAIVNAQNMTAQQVFGRVILVLKALDKAFSDVNDLFTWSSGISAADLQTLPGAMSSGDAIALLTAINDAHAEYMLRTTGLPPGSYPQPPSAYIYEQSQAAVIGPN